MTSAPGWNPSSSTSSQVPPACSFSQQDEPAAHRADGDVEVAVVVVVGRGASAGEERADLVQADLAAELLEAAGRALGGQVAERLDGSRSAEVAVTGMSPFDEDEIEVGVEVEVGPGDAPARGAAEVDPEVGAHVVVGRVVLVRGLAAEDPVHLLARVGDEEVGAAVAVVVAACDPHPRVRVGDAGGGRALLEAEAQARPGRRRLRPATRRSRTAGWGSCRWRGRRRGRRRGRGPRTARRARRRSWRPRARPSRPTSRKLAWPLSASPSFRKRRSRTPM